jgi:hypothetical protein
MVHTAALCNFLDVCESFAVHFFTAKCCKLCTAESGGVRGMPPAEVLRMKLLKIKYVSINNNQSTTHKNTADSQNVISIELMSDIGQCSTQYWYNESIIITNL